MKYPDYQKAQGDLTLQYLDREISPYQYACKLDELKNSLEGFPTELEVIVTRLLELLKEGINNLCDSGRKAMEKICGKKTV